MNSLPFLSAIHRNKLNSHIQWERDHQVVDWATRGRPETPSEEEVMELNIREELSLRQEVR